MTAEKIAGDGTAGRTGALAAKFRAIAPMSSCPARAFTAKARESTAIARESTAIARKPTAKTRDFTAIAVGVKSAQNAVF